MSSNMRINPTSFLPGAAGWKRRTKLSMRSPSTNSKIMASSPLAGSMRAPWSATIQACRTRRNSRNSLLKEASSRAPFRTVFLRGTLIATGNPRKWPMTTTPKPPQPQTTVGHKSSSSAVPTSQCSRTPISTMCSSPARIEASPGAFRPANKRSTSAKTCSVLATEGAMVPRPHSEGTARHSSNTPSSKMVPRSSARPPSVGKCSTWLIPTSA
mmetsp:Transcript_70440/g.204286  ORF Transcript_70440/g.204286 Transcript_70440/m.204286 type:complete len:213 (-) Transcript_70440:1102-1740(-)